MTRGRKKMAARVESVIGEEESDILWERRNQTMI